MKSRAVIIPAVLVLALVAIIVWHEGSQGTGREEAWYDIDAQGNIIASFGGGIFRYSSQGQASQKLVEGREVAFLPSGDKFLFENNNRIWLYDLAKHLATPITGPHAGQIDWYPTWSGTSNSIIFGRAEGLRAKSMGGSAGDSYDLYSIRADGTALTRLTKERFYAVSISPQSSFRNILYFVGTSFSPTESAGKIYRLDLHQKILTPVPGSEGARDVSVSHNGKQLLITRGPGYYSIELLNLDSGAFSMVKSPGDGYVDNVSFSKDDQNALFLEDKTRSDNFCIIKLNLSTRHETCLLRPRSFF